MATEREQRVNVKVARAVRHRVAMTERWQAFLATAPYAVVDEHRPDTNQLVSVVRFNIEAAAFPADELALDVGDCVHNLRTALDHLMWQLVESNGVTATKGTQFPIASSQALYKAQADRQATGISKDARRELDRLQPYSGGCDELWLLHDMDIVDKHRLIRSSLCNRDLSTSTSACTCRSCSELTAAARSTVTSPG